MRESDPWETCRCRFVVTRSKMRDPRPECKWSCAARGFRAGSKSPLDKTFLLCYEQDMAKKRPSIAWRRASMLSDGPHSKMNPAYWRGRLFRNTFTHNGDRFQVNHWSVKIQHLRARKTFSLQAGNPARAAV